MAQVQPQVLSLLTGPKTQSPSRGEPPPQYLRPGKLQFSSFASPRGRVKWRRERVPLAESGDGPSLPGAPYFIFRMGFCPISSKQPRLKMSVFAFTVSLSPSAHQVFCCLSPRSIENSVPFRDADSDKYSAFPVSMPNGNQMAANSCIVSHKSP